MQDLGTLGGLYSAASALNDSDTIVGYSDPTPLATAPHAFLWNQIGGMRDLGTLGGCGSVASGINRGGQVVGFSYIAPCSVLHAFLWTEAGGMQDLGTLGGPESLATAINDNGVVVGLSNTADGLTHAFRWTQSAKMQDLGTFPGGNWSVANAIHKSKVVGSASGENIKSAPFIWTAATGMKMVGPFGNLRIDGADGINSLGQLIVSTYGRWGYSSRLLTPLSPTSVSLVSSLNPSTSGQWVKITAAVSGTGPFAPTGTVAFRNGTTGIGSGTLIGGVAKILKNNLPTGTLSITATYSGDMWSKKSTSPVLIQVVNPAP
jgi:probable HAF family extracellular repeat protein